MTWPNERSRDGGIDEIPLPPSVGGRLLVCGKHVVGPDPEAALVRVGATTVVCLNETSELDARFPEYVGWLASNRSERALHHPIPDFHAPGPRELDELIEELRTRLMAGERLLLHCGAGIGRTGTIAVALLMRLGASMEDALTTVRAHRPMAGPEAGTQADALRAFELVCQERITEDR